MNYTYLTDKLNKLDINLKTKEICNRLFIQNEDIYFVVYLFNKKILDIHNFNTTIKDIDLIKNIIRTLENFCIKTNREGVLLYLKNNSEIQKEPPKLIEKENKLIKNIIKKLNYELVDTMKGSIPITTYIYRKKLNKVKKKRKPTGKI